MSKKIKRCAWAGEIQPRLHRISRQGMGRSGLGRPDAVRIPDSRRRAGGPKLVHDSEQARRAIERISQILTSTKSPDLLRSAIDKILQDPGIVRNKLKVNSAVINAKIVPQGAGRI